jgi:DNA excision repair protein ERCC-4
MRWTGALHREKTAFEHLIATKEHMVISLPDLKCDLDAAKREDAKYLGDTRTLNREFGYASSSTTIPGMGRFSRKTFAQSSNSIIVDVREFRSSLPSLLHAAGFKIIPRTLNVGDYILSDEICVERKGISDLFQSFASGRLHNQAEAMSKHYKFPCLLIEFNPEKPFSLQAAGEITSEIQASSISTKISVLALSFPNLRILWSK